jgi:hypothetical protein
LLLFYHFDICIWNYSHNSSPLVLSGARVARSLVLCVMFRRSLFCCPFFLAIVMSFFDLRLLITPLVSYIYGFWLPLWYLRFTASDYPCDILDYDFWLPLWYLRFTASDYLLGTSSQPKVQTHLTFCVWDAVDFLWVTSIFYTNKWAS